MSELPWVEAKKVVSKIEKPVIPNRVFEIKTCEIHSDGEIRPALINAINECKKNKGGKIIIPAGKYRCKGPIQLCSHLELHFEKGAYIKFSTRPEDYLPIVLTRWEGVDIFNYSPLIYGANLHDVSITGEGIIDGGAESWQSFRAKQAPSLEILRSLAEKNVPLEKRIFGEDCYLRPSMLQLIRTQRLLIEGVTLVNAPFWMVHPVYCEHITIKNVNFDSMYMNNDGIDIDSSHTVLIDNCRFRNGDDGIVMKSGRDKDGWDVGIPTKDVVVQNCSFAEVLHGFSIGSEMSGGVENIYIHNCTFGLVMGIALQFKSNRDRGSYIRNIYIQDLIITKVEQFLLHFTNDYHSYRGGDAPSVFNNFLIKNLTCENAKNAIHFQGIETHPIQNITLENFKVNSTKNPISSFVHSKNISLKDVFMNQKELKKLE